MTKQTDFAKGAGDRPGLSILPEGTPPYGGRGGRKCCDVGSDTGTCHGFPTCLCQHVLKAKVHTPDFFDHGAEKGHQRFASQGWANIAERYLTGNIYLRIGAFWGDGPIVGQFGKYYALIQIAGAREDEPTTVNDVVIDSLNAPLGVDSDEFHVFVDIRHAEDGPKRLVRSVVRPEHDDLFDKIAVELVNLVGPARALEILKPVTAREFDVFNVNGGGAKPCKGHGGLIEGRPELVNQLPRQNVYDFWRVRVYDDFRQFASRLRFRIENDPARVLLEEIPLGPFKLDEVVICAI